MRIFTGCVIFKSICARREVEPTSRHDANEPPNAVESPKPTHGSPQRFEPSGIPAKGIRRKECGNCTGSGWMHMFGYVAINGSWSAEPVEYVTPCMECSEFREQIWAEKQSKSDGRSGDE